MHLFSSTAKFLKKITNIRQLKQTLMRSTKLNLLDYLKKTFIATTAAASALKEQQDNIGLMKHQLQVRARQKQTTPYCKQQIGKSDYYARMNDSAKTELVVIQFD